ncbi:MAG TPA: phosphatase PAP2 family protein, partial [Acidobacteriaceae bacterium]|nr:phosphatase PAP2 family protein [Acidobacteriaceae bacterium]
TPAREAKLKLSVLFLLLGLILSIVVMLVLAKIHEEIAQPFLEHVDRQVMQLIHAHDTPALTRLAFTLSFIGSPLALGPGITLAAVVLWAVKLRRDAMLLILAIGGAGLIDTMLKLHFRRIRPNVPWALVTEHSFSFPSGHSAGAVVLYGIVTYLIWSHLHDFVERAGVIASALLLIAGIGASRVYIGVHYPTDVAAGYLVGLLWLLSLIGANEYLKRDEPPHYDIA